MNKNQWPIGLDVNEFKLENIKKEKLTMETIKDIVAEMRKGSIYNENGCIYLHELADRIEAANNRELADALDTGAFVAAAHKREREATSKNPLEVGNNAKMREALELVLTKLAWLSPRIIHIRSKENVTPPWVVELMKIVTIALAEPPYGISSNGYFPKRKENAMKANNNQKLREALMFTYCQLTTAIEDDEVGGNVLYLAGCMREVANKCLAALSAPPRNCDVGTAEEQEDRFADFCRKHECTMNCPVKKKWSFRCGHKPSCGVLWSQMPYEEGGKK